MKRSPDDYDPADQTSDLQVGWDGLGVRFTLAVQRVARRHMRGILVAVALLVGSVALWVLIAAIRSGIAGVKEILE